MQRGEVLLNIGLRLLDLSGKFRAEASLRVRRGRLTYTYTFVCRLLRDKPSVYGLTQLSVAGVKNALTFIERAKSLELEAKRGGLSAAPFVSAAPNEDMIAVVLADEAAIDGCSEAGIVELDREIRLVGLARLRPGRADLHAGRIDAVVGRVLDRLSDGLDCHFGLEGEGCDGAGEAVAVAGECADGRHIKSPCGSEAAQCGLACAPQGAASGAGSPQGNGNFAA